MDKLVLGDGMTEGVSQGPIINRSQFDKVNYFLLATLLFAVEGISRKIG